MPKKIGKMRILHAPINLSNQAWILAKALRGLGYTAHCCEYGVPLRGYDCDFAFNLNVKQKLFHPKVYGFFSKSLFNYDVFHFHFSLSLLPINLDLPILKTFGKRLVMQVWGSDVRLKSIAKLKNPYIKVKEDSFCTERRIKQRLRRISSFVSTCIIPDYELYEYVKPYFKKISIIRPALDVENYKPNYLNYDNKRKLRIIHAPTHKGVKGTEVILDAISRLKRKYDFEFVLVENMLHKDLMEEIRKSDIVIDQVIIGAYGQISIESMALGKPAVCYIREDLKSKHPPEFPIISATPRDIHDVLDKLISRRELLSEIGQLGRSYVEKYHDARIVAKELLEVYEELG